MPLTKEVVSFPFAAGLDEKSSDKTTPPGKLVTADNVRIEKTGQFIKREAYVKQSRTSKAINTYTSFDATVGKSVIPHKDSLMILAKNHAHRRTGSLNETTANDLVGFEPYTHCTMTHDLVTNDRRYKCGNAHHVRSNNMDCFVYVRYALETGALTYETIFEVYDAETNERIHNEMLDSFTITLAFASSDTKSHYKHPQPQLIALGNYVFVFINDSGTLKYTSITTNTGLASGLNPGSLATISGGPTLLAATPLFAVDLAQNYYTTNTVGSAEAICLAAVTGADVIRVGYLTNSSGTLSMNASHKVDFDVLDNGDVDRQLAWAELDAANDEDPVAAGLSLTCLNDINAADTDKVIAIMHTVAGGGGAQAVTTIFGANLAANETHNLAPTSKLNFMVTSGAASGSNGGTVFFFTEIANEATVIDASSSSAADRYCDHYVYVTQVNRGVGVTATTLAAANCSLTSHPFRRGIHVYAALTHYSCNQFIQGDGASSNMFLIDGTYFTPHAAGSVGFAPIAFAAESHARVAPIHRRLVYGLQRVAEVSTDKFMFGCSKFVGFVEYLHGNGFQAEASFATASCVVDFNLDRPVQHVESGKVTLFTGGCLMSYDGRRIVESGFITPPKIVESRAAGTGTSMVNAAHTYCAIWEWVDAMGNVHRSAPSNLEIITPGANTTVEIEVLELPATRKTTTAFSNPINDVRCVLYRSVPTGSVLYRYSEMKSVWGNLTIQFTDDNAFYGTNALLEDNEQLYTTGELSNGFIGSCTDIAKHKSRIFVRTTENIVNCSKPLFEGDAPAFVTDQLAYNIILDGESNPITCIESNLEHLLIFTDENGYILAGDGPDAFGTGGFLKPRKFAPGIGVLASSPHTVTRDGAFLVTSRGLYLVKPNLAIEYIGAAVEDQVAAAKGVLSIDVLDATNEVLVMLDNLDKTGGGTDTVLRYNYAFQQWTADKVAFGLTYTQIDGCVLAGEYYRMTAEATLHKQTPGGATFQDSSHGLGGGSYTPQTYNVVLKTGFIPRAGLQKSQRMYRWMLLGDYISDFTLTVKTFTDYSGSADTTFTKSVTSGFDNPMQFRGHIDKQKSQAIAVEITAAGTGACAKLDSLALEVGRRPAKTSIKLPATETL